jgi:hypothetical protein
MMKTRRMLSRLALLGGLGLSLLVAANQERTATALVCPGGLPECNTAANCAGFCPGLAICNRAHCCVCPP